MSSFNNLTTDKIQQTISVIKSWKTAVINPHHYSTWTKCCQLYRQRNSKWRFSLIYSVKENGVSWVCISLGCVSTKQKALFLRRVIRLCGLSMEHEGWVWVYSLCYWYYSLSHFSCLREVWASKFCPAEPALLSAALNINTCLRWPINTQYRKGKEDQALHISHVHEDLKWGQSWKGEVIENTHKCKGIWKRTLQGVSWLSTCCSCYRLWFSRKHSVHLAPKPC